MYIYILLWSVSADKIGHWASTKTDLYTKCWKITKIYDNDVYYIYNYVIYIYIIYNYNMYIYIYTHRTWPSPSLDDVKWSEWRQEKVLQIIFEVHVVRPVASVSSNIFKPKIHLENTGRKATVKWSDRIIPESLPNSNHLFFFRSGVVHPVLHVGFETVASGHESSPRSIKSVLDVISPPQPPQPQDVSYVASSQTKNKKNKN